MTAYPGYDNVGNLNTLRFSGFILGVFLLLIRTSYGLKPFDMHSATAYALQINSCVRFTKEVTAFRSAAITELTPRSEGAGEAALGPLDVMERLSVVKFYLIARTVNSRQHDAFVQYLSKQRGVEWLRCLRRPSTYKIPPPVFMVDEEDLEGYLRFIALMESIRALAKPSVQRPKFPRTMEAMPYWSISRRGGA